MAKKHECELRTEERLYGLAIHYCYEEDDGTLWVGNGEYESQVNFCPFCGQRAKTQWTDCGCFTDGNGVCDLHKETLWLTN